MKSPYGHQPRQEIYQGFRRVLCAFVIQAETAPSALLAALSHRLLQFILLALLFCSLSTTGPAQIILGKGTLNLNASVIGTYTSNYSGSNLQDDASFLTLSPQINYARTSGLLQTSADAGVQIQRSLSSPRQDMELWNAGTTLTLVQGVAGTATASLGLNHSENNSADYQLNARILTRTSSLNGQVGMTLASRLTLSATATYGHIARDDFPSSDTLGAGSQLQFAIGSTGSIFASYQYSESQTSRTASVPIALDQSTNTLSVGASKTFATRVSARTGINYTWFQRSAQETRTGKSGDNSANFFASLDGPFLPPRLFPKLTSSFSLNYGKAATPGLNDNNSAQITGGLQLAWAARLNTQLSTSITRSRDLTANSLSAETTSTQLGVTQTFVDKLAISGALGYQWITVRGVDRKSEATTASLNANRPVGAKGHWNVMASYSWRNSTSDDAIAQYTSHSVVGSIGYRY